VRILVVEDELKTATLIHKALQAEGFSVDLCENGERALEASRAITYEAIVLDIMLPGLDGLSVLRQFREQHNPTPILLLSARSSPQERVQGLNCGADDYLPKPFLMAELVARLRALGRRAADSKTAVLKVADLALDPVSRRVERSGKAIELTSREYALLEFLMRSAGQVCSRMVVYQNVWDFRFDPGSNLLEVYIRRLREKIDGDFELKLLHTIRGIGYVLKEAL
jgi:DNA-binding response OmpR family regulator